MKNYLTNLYRVLFEFDFSEVGTKTTMPVAVLTLIISSLFLYIAKHTLPNGVWQEVFYVLGAILFVCCIVFVWGMTAIFFEFIMKIFNKAGKIRKLLTLTSFSLLPYLFIAPCENIKRLGEIGYFLGTKFELLLFLWVIIIYAKALANTYEINKASSYMLVFLPIITLLFSFIWVIGTCFNIGYIYTV